MAREYASTDPEHRDHGAHRRGQRPRRRSGSSIYTGVTHKMGEVHEGAATMDWMEQEQERGITITSAATTCFWRSATTASTSSIRPATSTSRSRWSGRSVFSMAPWRSSARWRASSRSPRRCGGRPDRYRVPRIAFVNKMDRTAPISTAASCKIRERLEG